MVTQDSSESRADVRLYFVVHNRFRLATTRLVDAAARSFHDECRERRGEVFVTVGVLSSRGWPSPTLTAWPSSRNLEIAARRRGVLVGRRARSSGRGPARTTRVASSRRGRAEVTKPFGTLA